jgi:hypothetical protein
MITDHERFKDVADGVQSIVSSVAVVVGPLDSQHFLHIAMEQDVSG